MENNNLNPLPWYDSIERQDHRKWYANGEMFELATPRANLLPFQIRRRARGTSTDGITVEIYKCSGALYRDITTDFKAAGLTIETVNANFENIIYRANKPLTTPMELGTYYAVLTDGVDTWWSEMFCVVPNIEDYIKLEYWAVENQEYDGGDGLVIYETGFVNTLYIKSTICRPDYENEDENTKRDGYVFTEKKTSKKIFSFAFYAPEYMVDALRLPYVADFVRITSNEDEYKIFDFLATPKWTDNGYGHYASVTVEAQLDTILKKIQPSRTFTPDIIIVGRVHDTTRGTPLADATVTLTGQYPTQNIGVVKTDKNGYFQYRWFVAQANYPQNVVATVTKTGYITNAGQASETYAYAIKNGISIGDIPLEMDVVIACTWDNFINIWQQVTLTATCTWADFINVWQEVTPDAECAWDDYINIWMETCINAYSTAYSKAYNCNSPGDGIKLTPKNVSLPQTGEGVDVQVETEGDWSVE